MSSCSNYLDAGAVRALAGAADAARRWLLCHSFTCILAALMLDLQAPQMGAAGAVESTAPKDALYRARYAALLAIPRRRRRPPEEKRRRRRTARPTRLNMLLQNQRRWRIHNGRAEGLAPLCQTTQDEEVPTPTTTTAKAVQTVTDEFGVASVVTEGEFVTEKDLSAEEKYRNKYQAKRLPVDKDQLVLLHNQVRAETEPSAGDMRCLTWDDELAWIAHQKMNQCDYSDDNVFGENWSNKPHQNVDRHHGLNQEVGFNSYFWPQDETGHTKPPQDYIKTAIDAWKYEKRFYDYSTRLCQGVCRHYLQMVWAETYKIGCSYMYCNERTLVNGHDFPKSGTLLCAYAPRGNVVDYTHPLANSVNYMDPGDLAMAPYRKGTACSSCGVYLTSIVGKDKQKVKKFGSDSCENEFKCCKNDKRDKPTPFVTPYAPFTTSIPWTTTITLGTNQMTSCRTTQVGRAFNLNTAATDGDNRAKLVDGQIDVVDTQIPSNVLWEEQMSAAEWDEQIDASSGASRPCVSRSLLAAGVVGFVCVLAGSV